MMACKSDRVAVSKRMPVSKKLEERSERKKDAVAVAVVADELNAAITRALQRLESAGISEEIAIQAFHRAIEAIQRCFTPVKDETDPASRNPTETV